MIKELSVLSQRFNDFFTQCQTEKLSVFFFQNRFWVAKESLAARLYSLAPLTFFLTARAYLNTQKYDCFAV